MSQSLCKIYVHIIFHIKTTSPSILEEHLERVHSYIGQLINTTGCQSILVGGVSNHVHIVCQLSKSETISHLLEEVKRNSSRWIKTIDDRYRDFAWQGGYAAFSVSESVLPKTIDYVRNQKTHHKKISFQNEYLYFLKLYRVKYDKRYVFSD
jgi:REP element-mobilizing transposase RayT